MSNEHVLMVPNGTKIAMGHTRDKREIDDVYIDMTGWREDADLRENGIYPYRVQFVDDAEHRCDVVCTGCKSGGMKLLFDSVKKKWGLVPSDRTTVHVIAPRGYIANDNIPYGGVSVCSLQSLRKHGMAALDFQPIVDGKINVRLESVLDELVHQEINGYDHPLMRNAVFENSVYPYANIDYDAREQYLMDEYVNTL